ncbi:unnamed protein product [Litomosoides sigmodontis]|uniref:Uncharacterized protein n=1 Tax=Litomosoides sigmodontis TaxID=42156 RepID=A0A3P6SS23_LITSI|nr:unnamed protein product [Litomosoides sigmodontis]
MVRSDCDNSETPPLTTCATCRTSRSAMEELKKRNYFARFGYVCLLAWGAPPYVAPIPNSITLAGKSRTMLGTDGISSTYVVICGINREIVSNVEPKDYCYIAFCSNFLSAANLRQLETFQDFNDLKTLALEAKDSNCHMLFE